MFPTRPTPTIAKAPKSEDLDRAVLMFAKPPFMSWKPMRNLFMEPGGPNLFLRNAIRIRHEVLNRMLRVVLSPPALGLESLLASVDIVNVDQTDTSLPP